MVGPDGALPLPWLDAPLRQALAASTAHALLIHGPAGIGQFELALTLAQAWLCEAADASAARPCGRCASCRLVQAHSHPDLLVLLPEALREPLGWLFGEPDPAKKPSKDIRVDEVRAAVAFSQSTSARGRFKVVVLYPAERLNLVAANALLKTLEEPPGDTRLVLAGSAVDALPATVRSRCHRVPIALPSAVQGAAWLAAEGIAQPEVLLAAAGGQPQQALEWSRQGIDAAGWQRLPALVAQGSAAGFANWPLPRVVETLQKLCHDALCVAAGAAPRYFPVATIAAGADPGALQAWRAELLRTARHVEHPWNAGLLLDALVQQGARALVRGAARAPPRGTSSLHSAP